MKRFVLALQFLTVLRVKKDIAAEPEELAASMAYFPVVGALQGLILVAASYVFAGILPETVTAGLLVCILVITNGGLHLDGFADTVDGLAGGSSREERLRIMRDSSVGAIGVVFLILILLIKYLVISELPFDARRQVIFMFPVVGRWAMVPMAFWSNYARPEGGIGAAFASNSRFTFYVSTAITALLSAVLIGYLSLLIILFTGVMVYFTAYYFKMKIGGVTGDVFGFQSETAEAVFLVSALALINLFSA